MIKSFADKQTKKLWNSEAAKGLPADVQRVALRKLRMLNNATIVADLRIPPANRLEALKGDMKGRYSIRVNDQWRLVFGFEDGNVHDVSMIDYH